MSLIRFLGGASRPKYRLPLISDLSSLVGDLGDGLVARDSGASYIDTDGVLQIADGDETPLSHASIEDETSYTSMRGSFVDGQAWFDGEILSNDYTSDFSAGADNFASEFDVVVVGNIDGISDGTISYDNVLRITMGGTANTYQIAKNDTDLSFESDKLYRVTFKYYIPAGNALVDGFKITAQTRTSSIIYDGVSTGLNPATIGEWITKICYFEASSSVIDHLRIYLHDGADETPDGNGADLFYIKDVTVDEVTSLSTQSYSGNLLIADDGDGDKAFGFIGEAGTGEVLSALPNNVTGITKANPGVVSSVAHSVAVGTVIYYSGLTEMTELNGTYKIVTAVGSADTYSINNTSGYGAAETTGGACGKEVTEPNANAVKIYKEYSLTNEGWNALDAGIDYNAGASWDFDVYANLMSASGSTAQARFETNGLLSEGEGTNFCLQSNDLTEAVWTASNITPLKDVTGVDGVANSASRLTATAGNGTILQSINTLASATHIYSVWMKRITGTGSVEMTDDNGGNWTAKTLTASWQRFDITRSQTDPIVGIRIVTSGDVIGVQFNQVEASQAYATSAIPTTTIPVTRTTDSHSWTMSTAFKNLMGTVADSPFTMVCEFTPKFDYGDTDGSEAVISVKNAVGPFYTDNNGNVISGDGTNTSTVDNDYVAGTTYIFALRVFLDGTMKFEVGEKHGGSWAWDASPAAYDGSFNPSTDLIIGHSNEYPFNIKNIYFYDEAKTQAWIEGNF